MANDEEEVAHILERLTTVLVLRTRSMFGGVGIYHGDVFFGLIDDDQLYFRVDDASRSDFERAGMWAFAPIPGKPSMRTYYAVPPRVLASRALLGPWTRRAVEAARSAGTKRVGAAAKSRGTPKPATATATATASRRTSAHARSPSSSATAAVGTLLNLGPKSTAWLAEIGVHTRADLERMGSVAAYCAVRARGRSTNSNLLDALEGALLGLRHVWLSTEIKLNLRVRVEALEGGTTSGARAASLKRVRARQRSGP